IYNRLNSTSSMFDTSASLTPYDVKVIGGQVEFKYQAGLQTGADPFGNPIYGSWTDPATVTIGAPINNPYVDYDYDGNRVDIALGDAGAVQEGAALSMTLRSQRSAARLMPRLYRPGPRRRSRCVSTSAAP
ncbi:hypothetical protein, partial [Gemmatimonas sp.]|uniref:hypothetical protein n=1 Tax=Gemmatimonas sp. TaxID=1962908 RepID=UPI00391F35B4